MPKSQTVPINQNVGNYFWWVKTLYFTFFLLQDMTEDEEIMAAAIKLSMSANEDGANESLSEIAEIDPQSASGLKNLLAQQDSLKESQEEVLQKVISCEIADSFHLQLIARKSIHGGLLQSKVKVQNLLCWWRFAPSLNFIKPNTLHIMQLPLGKFEASSMLSTLYPSVCWLVKKIRKDSIHVVLTWVPKKSLR